MVLNLITFNYYDVTKLSHLKVLGYIVVELFLSMLKIQQRYKGPSGSLFQ